MWRRFALLRLNLPLASFLKRFAAPLLVFNFGMGATPVFSLAPGAPCGRLWARTLLMGTTELRLLLLRFLCGDRQARRCSRLLRSGRWLCRFLCRRLGRFSR